MNKKTFYLSGRITGIEAEAAMLFEAVEQRMIAAGHQVVNPMKLPHNHDKSYNSYMKECIRAMMECDCLLMLTGWKDSNGANIEHDIARTFEIPITYE